MSLKEWIKELQKLIYEAELPLEVVKQANLSDSEGELHDEFCDTWLDGVTPKEAFDKHFN